MGGSADYGGNQQGNSLPSLFQGEIFFPFLILFKTFFGGSREIKSFLEELYTL